MDEKSLSPAIPRRRGAMVTNDWCISYPLSAQRSWGWSKSLLDTQSFCWFWHAVAHLHLCLCIKPTKWPLWLVMTQTRQCICPVWSASSLCTHWEAKDWRFLSVDKEDSYQTGRMPRLIWVFAERTSFCWFCHAAAQLSMRKQSRKLRKSNYNSYRQLMEEIIHLITSNLALFELWSSSNDLNHLETIKVRFTATKKLFLPVLYCWS